MVPDPPLTPTQVELLRDSFVAVLLDQQRAGQLFYDHLFAIAPEVRPLFGHNMAAQRRVLIQTLAMTVTGLGNVATLQPAITALGRRHGSYGVRTEHYPPVGEALIHMVKVMGGSAFDADTEDAWRVAYVYIADRMIAASSADQPAT